MDYSIKKWDKHLIRYLWIIVIVSTLFTLSNINHVKVEREVFWIERLLLPFVIQVLVVSLLQFAVKKDLKSTPYLLISGSQLIVIVLAMVHYPVIKYLLPLYLLPIFMSVFFLDKHVTVFAFATSVLSFVTKKFLYPPLMNMDYVQTTTLLAIIVTSFFLAKALTNRFLILYNDLIISVGKEKELVYKNIYMERLMKMDLATNLYNHKTFHQYLNELIMQHHKAPFDLSLALLDLDHFKKINDTYGHGTGDMVIAETAGLIKDISESDDFVARYGGEEFAVIFTGKEPRRCLDLLEQIRVKLSSKRFEEMPNVQVTISVGYVNMIEGMSKNQLFNLADEKLYQAKEKGRNQIVSFS